MISYYIFLALFNGMIIGINRAINGRLSMDIGPFKASFWNHLIGFVFLTLILLILNGMNISKLAQWNTITTIPSFAFLGGFFGAFFVAVNSYVFSKIGAMKAALLVISGQMISSVLIDYKSGATLFILAQLFGVSLILLGLYFSKKMHQTQADGEKIYESK